VRWEFVHIAIDDATRLAYAEVLPDEKATTAIAFLRRAIAFYKRHGMTVRELLTDNGSPYRSSVHAIACRAWGIRHLRTRPRRPQTNGKPSDSSEPCSPAGPTARSAAQANNAPQPLTAGSGTTTIADDTKPSGDRRPITRLNNLLGTYT
jgi:Integrase core domain